jgi:hypothetical protein
MEILIPFWKRWAVRSKYHLTILSCNHMFFLPNIFIRLTSTGRSLCPPGSHCRRRSQRPNLVINAWVIRNFAIIGTLLLGTLWLGTLWLGTFWLGTLWLGTLWLGTLWLGTLWLGALWLGTLWLGTLWLGTLWLGTLWLGTLWFGSFVPIPIVFEWKWKFIARPQHFEKCKPVLEFLNNLWGLGTK